jgi:large subunit ribosomal protein L4
MPKLPVVTMANQGAGSVELDGSVFGAAVKPHLFHAEVRRQLARRRAGTHSTKNRAGVSGGGIKPYRQKGTGRARQGTIRAPQWEGGGVVFGPVPRSYEHRLPRKVRAAALRSALSLRAREEAVTVVDALSLGEYRTRRMREILGTLGLDGRSVLVVIDAADPHVERSARNLPDVAVVRAEGLNVHDVLRHERLLLTRAALARVEERLSAARAATEPGGGPERGAKTSRGKPKGGAES